MALAVVMLAAGCAPRLVVREKPAAAVNAWGLAVYPVVFRFDASPYESFARGRDVAERLSERTGLSVYGPGEFTVSDAETDDLVRGTTLPSALHYSKARRPEGMYAVRVVVEERVASGTAEVFDASGRLRGASREERVEVQVVATLLSYGTRAAVAELAGDAKVDPFADDFERDPYPDVTRLTGALVDALADLAGLTRSASVADVGLATLDVPAPAAAFAFAHEQSLDESLAGDPLAREGRMFALYSRIDPNASRARLRIFQHAPSGLVVTGASGAAAKAGLEVDDLIESADGETLFGRYALDRHLRLGRTTLVVRRAGEERKVELAAP